MSSRTGPASSWASLLAESKKKFEALLETTAPTTSASRYSLYDRLQRATRGITLVLKLKELHGEGSTFGHAKFLQLTLVRVELMKQDVSTNIYNNVQRLLGDVEGAKKELPKQQRSKEEPSAEAKKASNTVKKAVKKVKKKASKGANKPSKVIGKLTAGKEPVSSAGGESVQSIALGTFADSEEEQISHNYSHDPFLEAGVSMGVTELAVDAVNAHELAEYLKEKWKDGRLQLNDYEVCVGFDSYHRTLTTLSSEKQRLNTLHIPNNKLETARAEVRHANFPLGHLPA
jgi:hypothetical protein